MRSQWLVLVWLLLFSTAGFGKKLYKYQDDQGRWYFTDKAPETRQPVEVRQLKPAMKQWVRLESDRNLSNPGFYLINHYPGPIEVAVDWKQRGGLTATPALPQRFVLEPGKSAILFTVSGSGRKYAQKFSLEYRYVIGRPVPNYAGAAAYLPPLAAGSRFQITQGFNGEYSHNDEQNRYAVDIMMPVGTPVHAARAGTVLEVDNDFFVGGTQKAYADKANSVRILHDDGSMAVYAHLALEKAQVHAGLRVQAGELIAYSGNTGFSSGPHLHFAVQINRGMELVSVPFQFLSSDGQRFDPQQGSWLTGLASRPEVAAEQPQQGNDAK